jgi:hypothetical protein
MAMKSRIKRLERRTQSNYISIPQLGAPPERFPPSALAEAFESNMNQLRAAVGGRDIPPDHALTVAAKNSGDPKWRDSFIGGVGYVPITEDLSE